MPFNGVDTVDVIKSESLDWLGWSKSFETFVWQIYEKQAVFHVKNNTICWPTARGRYFAERAEFCLGHFWGAPGQNFSSLEENQKIL